MEKTRCILVLLALVILTSGASMAGRTPARAMTLVPPSLEFSVKPGESIDSRIKLINEESVGRTLYVSTANFTAKGETGEPNFLFDAPSTDLASWIKVSVDTVQLVAKQAVEIPFTVTVPSNAEPGGRYSGIFFANQPESASQAGQIVVGTKLGTLIIVTVEGDVSEKATIKEFGIGSQSPIAHLPANLFVRIANDGNVHVRPTGSVIVKNMLGKTTAVLTLNSGLGAILPHSTRRFDTTWRAQTGDAARGSFMVELGREWHNFAVGKYTATFAGTYGATKKTLAATTTFSIWPWELLLVFGIGLIIVIMLLIFFVKWYNGMIIRRAQVKMQRGRKQE